jgi:GT2 family glycosyltransferase
VLFAPGGCAVFHRARVLGIGGIDTTLVYGHEDANLGWRLALRGLRTIELSSSVAVAAGQPPAAEPADARMAATRLRHETANQLATLVMCAGDDWLRAALPASLARVICLAAADAGLRPGQFDFTSSIPATFSLPVIAVARLLALDDLIRHFPMLRTRREQVQSAREYTDDELRGLFINGPVDPQWEAAAGDGAHALCRMLGIWSQKSVPVARPASSVADDARPNPPATDSAGPAITPGVSIIVLTALGDRYLPECLDSLAQVNYPSAAIEVIVVDNGSLQDPTATVHRHYPGAKVVRTGRNLGFCGGNNAGVAHASHNWLLFLNDDTRVDRGLLRELLATSAHRGAAAVGAFVLDWTGTHVDFAGGGVSFDGNGFQDGIGSSDPSKWRRERSIPFANGAAMLVRRDAYLHAGGFPDRYFAYYEDVALGWALWTEGYQVWLSADALVYHKHHGTTTESPSAARMRNCERNARFTVLTHASADALPDLLSAALLMAGERVVMAAGLGGMVDDPLAFVNDHRLPIVSRLNPRLYVSQFRAEFRRQGAKRELGIMGSLSRVGISGLLKSIAPLYVVARWGGTRAPAIGATVDVPAEWTATLAGTAEWCQGAVDMEDRRAALQASRREDEHHFASRFPDNWLDPVLIEPSRQGEYERAHRVVVRHFELARFLRQSTRA